MDGGDGAHRQLEATSANGEQRQRQELPLRDKLREWEVSSATSTMATSPYLFGCLAQYRAELDW